MSEKVFDKAFISTEEWEKVKISRVNTRPNAKSSYGTGSYTASQTKDLFDAQGNLFREKHNALVDYARAEEAARKETFETNERARQETFEANEAARQETFEANERARQEIFEAEETERQETFEANEAARQENEREFFNEINEGLDYMLEVQESIIGGYAE